MTHLDTLCRDGTSGRSEPMHGGGDGRWERCLVRFASAVSTPTRAAARLLTALIPVGASPAAAATPDIDLTLMALLKEVCGLLEPSVPLPRSVTDALGALLEGCAATLAVHAPRGSAVRGQVLAVEIAGMHLVRAVVTRRSPGGLSALPGPGAALSCATVTSRDSGGSVGMLP